MLWRAFLLLLLLLTPVSMSAGYSESPVSLLIRGTHKTSIIAPVVTGFFRCDGAMNTFAQPYPGTQSPYLLKISADGKTTSEFQLKDARGFVGADIHDFTVTPDGEVLVLTAEPVTRRPAVVRFSNRGKFIDTTWLEAKLLPSAIAAFDRERFLIFAWEQSTQSEPVPLLAVFSTGGELLTRVGVLPGDVTNHKLSPEALQAALTGTVLESGGDGLVYVARKTNNGPVFVISPTGRVQRSFKLKQPDPEAVFLEIKHSKGRIAAIYVKESNSQATKNFQLIVQDIDASSGKVSRTYQSSDPSAGMGVACFDPSVPQFTFVGADSTGRLQNLAMAP